MLLALPLFAMMPPAEPCDVLGRGGTWLGLLLVFKDDRLLDPRLEVGAVFGW